MKRILFTALAAMLLCACSSETPEPLQQTETFTLRFGGFDFSEEPIITRTDVDVATIVTRLDMWVSDGTTTAEVHQSSADEGFGTVTLELNKAKTYTIYAVAHKATGAATLADGIISWPDDKVTHSFFYSGTVTPSTTTELSCRMNRIVGMFRLETTDAVPNECKKFRFQIPQTFHRWNVAGFGTTKKDRTVTVNVTSTQADGTVAVSLYIIGSSESVNYDITMDALDASDGVIVSHTVTAPICNNYKTCAKGAFFNAASTISFVSDDWNTIADINF